MAHLLGNNLIVQLGSTPAPIGAAKNCSIELDSDTIEVSSPTQGTYKNYLATRKGWRVTVGYLVTLTSGVTAMKNHFLMVGTTYTLTFNVRGDSNDKLTGQAICTACHIDAVRGSLVSGSFEFLGTGALS